MKRILNAPCFLAIALLSPMVWGCKGGERNDTVIASAANASHTWRATIILRQYWVDGKFDDSPTTYVLLDRDTGSGKYGNGEEFNASQIVMKPSQCGPLSVRWVDDNVLRVRCEKCGLARSAIGQHASAMGPVRIEYEGFPDMSSWESAPRAN